jgi:predicted aspartyl protease
MLRLDVGMVEEIGGRSMRWVVALACLVVATGWVRIAWAASCPVVQPHEASAAEKAFLAADYTKAEALYRDELAQHANDPALTAGLVRALLRDQKLSEAEQAVNAAMAANAGSAVLGTAKAEVQLRAGVPWEAGATIGEAGKADACLPRLHLIFARLARLNSMYATARANLLLAHELDPYDPDIRGDWIATLPPRERIAEMEKYLASPTGRDEEERHHLQLALDHLKKSLNEPHKACRLVSTAESTEIPFEPLMRDAQHVRAFGLDVKFNQHRARLEIDTGAGGLLVSRSVAEHAGMKPFSETEVGGIGDQGKKAGYTAFAESIQIGNLEFHDCAVRVVDNSRMMEIDGLIGMDVFSKFLVTLNYPERKLALTPLPKRAGEVAATPTLGTNAGGDDESPKVAPEADNAGSNEGAAKGAEAAQADATAGQPAKPVSKGPYDRYVAPEMKDYSPVYRVGHALILPVSLNRSKLKLFMLDTGAWATSISPDAAREVTKVHSDDSLHVRGLSGKVEKAYAADEVTFAFAHVAQKIRSVPSFDTSTTSKNLGLELSGFLGARTLKLTTIHIDYRDGLVKFDYDPSKVSSFPDN